MTDHRLDEGTTSQVEGVYLRVSPALDTLDLSQASMRGPALASYFHETYLARWGEAVEALPHPLDVLFYTDAMTQLAPARPLVSSERFTRALAALRADRAAGMTALAMLRALDISSRARNSGSCSHEPDRRLTRRA
jgi:hypothetical protein